MRTGFLCGIKTPQWVLISPVCSIVNSVTKVSVTPFLICYLKKTKCFNMLVSFSHLSAITRSKALDAHSCHIYTGTDVILKLISTPETKAVYVQVTHVKEHCPPFFSALSSHSGAFMTPVNNSNRRLRWKSLVISHILRTMRFPGAVAYMSCYYRCFRQISSHNMQAWNYFSGKIFSPGPGVSTLQRNGIQAAECSSASLWSTRGIHLLRGNTAQWAAFLR